MDKRVVITGLGAITPIGKNVEENWNSIKEKKCGIDEITLFNTENFKTKLAAEVKEYNPLEHFEAKQAKRLDRYSQFAIIAAREAVKSSEISKENTDFNRVGIFVSSGIGGLTTIQEQCRIDNEKGNKRVSPMFIPMSIANMAAGNIAIEFGFKGESMSILTACASSTHAIGEAYKKYPIALLTKYPTQSTSLTFSFILSPTVIPYRFIWNKLWFCSHNCSATSTLRQLILCALFFILIVYP